MKFNGTFIESKIAEKEYINSEKRIQNKIDELLKAIKINGLLGGIGKPEILKLEPYKGFYSRRVTKDNRLIYKPRNVDDNSYEIEIFQYLNHYSDH